jgi:hypothetical protein
LFYYYHTVKDITENFTGGVMESHKEPIYDSNIVNDMINYEMPTSKNPLQNVLITDYVNNPHKNPAMPSYVDSVQQRIVKEAKKAVKEMNPNHPELTDKLFQDLGEQFNFEQSMRPFYSTASTTIPNDQKAFTDFCYGDMISCKDGNKLACGRTIPRYNGI